MVEIISRESLAWLAGIIEGEGSFFIGRHPLKNSITFRSNISITNTDVRILKPASELLYQLGCKFYYQLKKTKSGYAMAINVCGIGSTNKVIDAILPFLRAKKDQAELLREFNDQMGQGRYQRNGIEWYQNLQLKYLDKLLTLRVHTINPQRLQRTASQPLEMMV